MNISVLYLSLFSLLVSGCATVKIPNAQVCTVAGKISAGADCAWTLSNQTSEMTFDEFLDFLEPQRARPDPGKPDITLPARAGALCQSAEDWNKNKTALEQACKLLGRNCSRTARAAIKRMDAFANRVR